MLVLFAGCSCGDDTPPAVQDAGGVDADPIDTGRDGCASDFECSDGRFCNGVERCSPDAPSADERGCIPAQLAPCLPTQTCDEGALACITDCLKKPDADGDGEEAPECGGQDCDDTDPARYPGRIEICDGENHDEDCRSDTFGNRDKDRDGFVDARCCNVSETSTGTLNCGLDCNDDRRDISPAVSESCDGFDNNCDGQIDEDVAVLMYADKDRDLHGDENDPGTMVCPGNNAFALNNDDCDDDDRHVHSAQVEICDNKDNDCNDAIDDQPVEVTWYGDNDSDGFGKPESGTTVSCVPPAGFSIMPTDCDDTRRGINPAADEECDGLDNNCDGYANFHFGGGDFEDDDGDGAVDLACPFNRGTDCDDNNPTVFPEAPEIDDDLDNDCDQTVDEEPISIRWYPDLDLDTWGDSLTSTAVFSISPVPGFVSRGGDCDDSDPAIHPAAADICDGRQADEDCDGEIDEDAVRFAYYQDPDGDGFGSDQLPPLFSCVPPGQGYAALPGDCSDLTSEYPHAGEVCDQQDNNCNDEIDEGLVTTYYFDNDTDGYGTNTASIATCMTPDPGYVIDGGDCDDNDPSVNPGEAELCDTIDNNCVNGTDELPDATDNCNLANATAQCIAGQCIFQACTSTTVASCDGRPSTGCEADLTSDALNCRDCGTVCGMGADCIQSSCETSIVKLAAATFNTCALRSNGRVVCWGNNPGLANGQDVSRQALAPERSLVDDAVDLYGGEGDHFCAINTAGFAVCWGNNQFGQTGDPIQSTTVVPHEMSSLPNVVQLAAGDDHTCAIVGSPGTVHCWGSNAKGQLGDDQVSGTGWTPTPVTVVGLTDAVQITAGRNSTCALRATGGVDCWGSNMNSALGRPSPPSQINRPNPVPGLPGPVRKIAAGDRHACVITEIAASSSIYCWGHNLYGAAGATAVYTIELPREIDAPPISDAIDIDLGGGFGCALRANGEVRCWGVNQTGSLGDGAAGNENNADNRPRCAPGDVTCQTTVTNAAQVVTGVFHSCMLMQGTNEVWCNGANNYGQIGINSTVDSLLPERVYYLP